MATDKTKGLTVRLHSVAAKAYMPTPIPPEARREALRLPAGQRPVLSTHRSADGRSLYAFDGVSIRKVR